MKYCEICEKMTEPALNEVGEEFCPDCGSEYGSSDPVNSPSHYTAGGIETINFIRAKLSREEFVGYCKGNVLKYVTRAALKGGVEDYSKAKVYLSWLIEAVEKEETTGG